jgi:hypothetical protein
VASPTKRGLGRGLTSIIPGAEQIERATRSPDEQLFRSLVDAGLDLLDELVAPEVSAYLHVPHDGEPQLELRRPPLTALTPTTAFRLFHTLAMLTNRTEDAGSFTYEDMTGWYVRSSGPASDGIHVVASHGLDPEDPVLGPATRAARAFGAVCHQFSAPPADELAPHLIVSVAGEETIVEAGVRVDDDVRTGRGTSSTAPDAVALAVLDAVGPGLTLDELRDVELDRGRAVLVVLAAEDGDLRLGLARSERDLLQTAAIATLRAIG